MSAVWVVSDDRGSVGTFGDIAVASEFVAAYPSTPFCITRQPLLRSDNGGESSTPEKVYLILHRRPDAVAAVAADEVAWTKHRDEMLKTNSTYPDPIGFFTRTLNKVHPNILSRLETREMVLEAEAAMAAESLAGEPVTTPAEEPEPAEEPAEEPAGEPAGEPAEKPAEEPAGELK